MGVYQAKAAKPAGAAARPADVGEFKSCGVTEDDIADESVAG